MYAHRGSLLRELLLLAATVLSVSCRSEGDYGRSAQSDSVAPPTSTQQDSDSSTRVGATDTSESSDSGPLVITPDGWGPLRIGMSRTEVVAAAGEDANPDAVGGPDSSSCDEFRPAGA